LVNLSFCKFDSGFKTKFESYYLGVYFEAFLFEDLPVHWYHLFVIKEYHRKQENSTWDTP